MSPRHTLAGEVRLSGWGLHGGCACAVTLAPAAPGAGRTFVRDGARIPATVAHVVDARRATTLGRDGARVGMVEHLLAALLVREIDDADLHVEGEEVPLLDGCARAWTDAIDAAGRLPQGRADVLRVPLIVVPIVNHDNRQHAADENLRLQNLWDGIELYAAIVARLGAAWPATPLP